VEHVKGKSKSKSKPTDKGKEKDLSARPYEYEDGSVHDNAIHADIFKGYERFKVGESSVLRCYRRSTILSYLQLTHGSFTSIYTWICTRHRRSSFFSSFAPSASRGFDD
jgi:hypothetical protein